MKEYYHLHYDKVVKEKKKRKGETLTPLCAKTNFYLIDQ
jgi:hypothetical protein